MGCSISTQTQTKEDNRPTTKLNDSNGPSTCEENHSVAENETIPDKSPLEMKEEILNPKETLLNDFCPPEDKGTLGILKGSRTPIPEEVAEKEVESSFAEVDKESRSPPENEAEQQDMEKALLSEGDSGEKVESKMHSETAANYGPETEEDEIGEAWGTAVTEREKASNKE